MAARTHRDIMLRSAKRRAGEAVDAVNAGMEFMLRTYGSRQRMSSTAGRAWDALDAVVNDLEHAMTALSDIDDGRHENGGSK